MPASTAPLLTLRGRASGPVLVQHLPKPAIRAVKFPRRGALAEMSCARHWAHRLVDLHYERNVFAQGAILRVREVAKVGGDACLLGEAVWATAACRLQAAFHHSFISPVEHPDLSTPRLQVPGVHQRTQIILPLRHILHLHVSRRHRTHNVPIVSDLHWHAGLRRRRRIAAQVLRGGRREMRRGGGDRRAPALTQHSNEVQVL